MSRITSFISRATPAIQYISEGATSTIYAHHNNPHNIRHFYSLLQDENYLINSCSNDHGSFKIGDRTSHYSVPITDFIFSPIGALCAVIGGGEMSVDALRVYEEPVVAVPAITGADINGIQQSFLRTNPITLKIADNPEFTHSGSRISRVRRESIVEFLRKFFMNWNDTRDTLNSNDGSVQTEAGRRRSLGDIFMICRYYYPSCTMKEVAKALMIDLPLLISDGFRNSYCHDINKKVWYYDNSDPNGVFDKTTNDEFGKPHRWWISELEN